MASCKLLVLLFGLSTLALSFDFSQLVLDGFQGFDANVPWSPSPPATNEQEQVFESGEKKTLKFDDIVTQEPLSEFLTYSNMTFASFKVLNVPLAIKNGFISEEDGDCATSKPNAIFGTVSPDRRPGRIYVSDDKCKTTPGDCSECAEEYPHTFKPISMQVKPLRFAGPVTVDIVGWELENGRALNMYRLPLFFGSGRHNGPFKVCFGDWKRPINLLAIQALGQMWDFDGGIAIDDFEVRF